jgi:hypothetical protein
MKALLIALIMACTFGVSQAQVRVSVGVHPHRYHRHRVVVVTRHRRPYHRY